MEVRINKTRRRTAHSHFLHTQYPFSNAKVQVAGGYLAQDSRQKDGAPVHVMVVMR